MIPPPGRRSVPDPPPVCPLPSGESGPRSPGSLMAFLFWHNETKTTQSERRGSGKVLLVTSCHMSALPVVGTHIKHASVVVSYRDQSSSCSEHSLSLCFYTPIKEGRLIVGGAKTACFSWLSLKSREKKNHAKQL